MPMLVKAKKNHDYDWDAFDPVEYVDRNYAKLGREDRQILEKMRGFFGSAGISNLSAQMHGVDVGSGPNVYPALAMMPFCDTVTLSDLGKANVSWLRNEVVSYSSIWDQYWKVLEKSPPYARVKDPRRSLRRKIRVERKNLFDLPSQRWDVGTMFFVAESISEERHEFERATKRFVTALKPDAPFVAAFMESSKGYYIGGRPFPAVGVGLQDVGECLDGIAHDVRICRLDPDEEHPLRDGYTGMILALGRAGSVRG